MNGIETTRDSLLGGRLTLLQPAAGYRFAIDPLLLAAAVPARAGERVLDVGCGVGTAALCLAVRVPGAAVAGLDANADLIALARRNAFEAGFDDRAAFENGDVRDMPPPFPRAGFDHVMANPPYGRADRANLDGNAAKASANVEGGAGIVAWVDFAAAMVRVRGSATFIFGADRLDELLTAMSGRFGSLVVFPLWPGPNDRPAKRVLLRGIRGGASPTTLARGLILHEAGGGFTAAAETVLREATPLRLMPRDA